MERATLVVGALAFLGATVVVAYIAVTAEGPVADTAVGALIALISAGASYFLRGRVQAPTTEDGHQAPPVPPLPSPDVLVQRAEQVAVVPRPDGPAPSPKPEPPKPQGSSIT